MGLVIQTNADGAAKKIAVYVGHTGNMMDTLAHVAGRLRCDRECKDVRGLVSKVETDYASDAVTVTAVVPEGRTAQEVERELCERIYARASESQPRELPPIDPECQEARTETCRA